MVGLQNAGKTSLLRVLAVSTCRRVAVSLASHKTDPKSSFSRAVNLRLSKSTDILEFARDGILTMPLRFAVRSQRSGSI